MALRKGKITYNALVDLGPGKNKSRFKNISHSRNLSRRLLENWLLDFSELRAGENKAVLKEDIEKGIVKPALESFALRFLLEDGFTEGVAGNLSLTNEAALARGVFTVTRTTSPASAFTSF